jgi:hypothetical protein
MEKIKNAFHTFCVWCFVAGLLVGCVYIAGWYLGRNTKFDLNDKKPKIEKSEVVKIESFKTMSPDRLSKAIEKMKNEVVEHLATLEGANTIVAGNQIFMTFDPSESSRSRCTRSGGIMDINCLSFGELQMKVGTIQMWYKQLGKGEISDMDAMNLAIDDKDARSFAKEVIFGIQGSVWHWAKAKKHREWFDTRITIIRELEKI